ncbi:hypothetical protein YWY31_37400 [Paenibacillus illinoisensis]|uniref:hypothetical protein n=1 Tax=Paenibacillus illinoisensis TaxID=59845 RepID=UPI0034C0C996
MKQFLLSFVYTADVQHAANVPEQTAVLHDDWIQHAGVQLMWLLLAVFVLQLIIWIRARLSRGTYSDEEVERTDPLYLAYLHSKGRIKLRDTLASLFALTRIGVLSVRIEQAKRRYREDKYAPDATLEYRHEHPAAEVAADEKELIQWLLKDYGFGNRKFRLDALAGPSSKLSSQSEEMQHYHRKERALRQGIQRWASRVRENRDWEGLVRTPIPLRLLVGIVFPLLWVLTGALCLNDDLSIGEGISLGASLLLWLFALIRIRVRWPFHTAGVGLLIAITLAEPNDPGGTGVVILAVLLTLLIRLLLPVREIAPSARDLAASINRWRRRYKKGIPADRMVEPAETLEQMLQTSLVLRVGSRCTRRTNWGLFQDHADYELRRLVQLKSGKTGVPPESTLLQAPLLRLALYLREEYRPLLAAEYPYERLNYIASSLESGSFGGSSVYSDSSDTNGKRYSRDHDGDHSGGHDHVTNGGDSGSAGDSGGGGD